MIKMSYRLRMHSAGQFARRFDAFVQKKLSTSQTFLKVVSFWKIGVVLDITDITVTFLVVILTHDFRH